MKTTTTTQLTDEQTDTVIKNAIGGLTRAADTAGMDEDAKRCLASHAATLECLLSDWTPPAPAPVSPPPRHRYLLYTLPDGERRVAELWGDYGLFAVYLLPERSPLDPDVRYADEDMPEEALTAGQEITEEEAYQLTGFYLNGTDLLPSVEVQLSRIRPGDPHEPFCRAMLEIIKGTPADEWGS